VGFTLTDIPDDKYSSNTINKKIDL
jgi:hypothetical protein